MKKKVIVPAIAVILLFTGEMQLIDFGWTLIGTFALTAFFFALLRFSSIIFCIEILL